MIDAILYSIVIIILSVFLASFLFKRYFNIAKTYNLYKGFTNRSSHKGNVYTGSGVLLAFMLLVATIFLNHISIFDFSSVYSIISTSILVAILGFYDDFLPISAFHKYITLSFLIGITVYSGSLESDTIILNIHGFLGIHEIPYIVGFLFTCFVYLAVINAINLMDGIDSYLAVFSCIVFLIFTVIFAHYNLYTYCVISIILIAGLSVFLRYNNSSKKKLFVGDAGSLFLGFWIAYFLILYINQAEHFDYNDIHNIKYQNIPILAVSIINMPVMDTLRVMLVRISKKKSPFAADQNHIHHIFLQKGFTHTHTSIILCMINAFNLCLMFLLEPSFDSINLTIAYVVINLFWLLIFRIIRIKLASY